MALHLRGVSLTPTLTLTRTRTRTLTLSLTVTLTLTLTLTLALTLRCPALNGFLSLPLFDAPAKLTYSAYLVHPILIRAYYFQARVRVRVGVWARVCVR